VLLGGLTAFVLAAAGLGIAQAPWYFEQPGPGNQQALGNLTKAVRATMAAPDVRRRAARQYERRHLSGAKSDA
jgi:hypothetical protein